MIMVCVRHEAVALRRVALRAHQSLDLFEHLAGVALVVDWRSMVLLQPRERYFRGLALTGCVVDSACNAVAIGKNNDAGLLAKRRNS
jgi:hypothetical protein